MPTRGISAYPYLARLYNWPPPDLFHSMTSEELEVTKDWVQKVIEIKEDTGTDETLVDIFLSGCQRLYAIPEDDILVISGVLNAIANGWVSNVGPGTPFGVWDSYNGDVCEVERIASLTEDKSPVVVYLSLSHNSWHVIKCSEWNEVVKWPDGQWRSRFVFRGQNLTSMPPSFKVQNY